MKWEDSFNANAVADLSDCESLSDAAVVLSDNDAFESLNSFRCAFYDLEEYLDCISNIEILCIFLDLLCFNSLNDVDC